MYTARTVLGVFCALVLCQCQSGPEIKRVVTLEPGDVVRVVYSDQAKGVALTLQNESIEPAETLYSRGTADPFVKVAKDEDLQLLLDALATYGFFQFARPVSPGGGRPALLVEVNDQVLTWERQVASQARAVDLQNFNSCYVYFQNAYNGTESFHAGVGMTREDLERQQQQLQQQGRIKTDRR